MSARIFKSTVEKRTISMAGGISSTATVITLDSGSTLPTSTYPYTLVIDPDLATEEIVTVTSSAGTAASLNITRGQDGTTAQAHSNGSVVRHMITGRDLGEAQAHIEATGAYSILNNGENPAVTSANITKTVHGIGTGEGDVVGTLKIQNLYSKTIIAPIISTASISLSTISSDSTIGGISGATIAADHGVWTSTTPTITSGWTGTPSLRYIQIGKTVHFHYTYIVAAGGSTATEMTVTLPVAAKTANSVRWISHGEFVGSSGARYLISAPINTTSGTSSITIYCPSNNTPAALVKYTPTAPVTSSGTDTVSISGTYEAA